MICELRPLDTYLFRDGRPFGPSDLTRARSSGALPMPATLYGALRNLLLEFYDLPYEHYKNPAKWMESTLPARLKQILGPADGVGELRIAGPFLRVDDGSLTLLPAPADLVLTQGPLGSRGFYVTPEEPSAGAKANYPPEAFPLNVRHAGTKLQPDDSAWGIAMERWFDGESLSDYLLQKSYGSLTGIVHLSPYSFLEPHTAIQRDAAKLSAEPGRLYTVDFQRLKGSFVFEVEDGGDCFPHAWTVAFGGERRPSRWRKGLPIAVNHSLRDAVRRHLLAHCLKNGVLRFRLYLTTPARFASNSWVPEVLAKGGFDGGGFTCSLISAALARGQTLSGFSLATNTPRHSQRIVPAGGVYFLEANGAEPAVMADAVLERFWFQPGLLHEDNPDRKMGFARTLVGGWNID